MLVKCTDCPAKVDCPDITDPIDAANAPIQCEPCWNAREAVKARSGFGCLSDDFAD
jgi:hypothetical protein